MRRVLAIQLAYGRVALFILRARWFRFSLIKRTHEIKHGREVDGSQSAFWAPGALAPPTHKARGREIDGSQSACWLRAIAHRLGISNHCLATFADMRCVTVAIFLLVMAFRLIALVNIALQWQTV